MHKFISFATIVALSLLASCDSGNSASPDNLNSTYSSTDDRFSSEASSNDVSSSSNKVSSSSEGFFSCSSTEVLESSSSQVEVANYNATTNTLTDERDGNIYKTVTIGNQVWMAENLKYKPERINDEVIDIYVCPDGKEEYCESHGMLYNWITMLQIDMSKPRTYPYLQESQKPFTGICPTGWHIPSLAEWQILLDHEYLNDLIAESEGGTGKSGFNILYSGISGMSTYGVGYSGFFATIDEAGEGYVVLNFEENKVKTRVDDLLYYVSLRCLKN